MSSADTPKPLTVLNGMITITRRWGDFHAVMTGHPNMWGCGANASEAIGHLIQVYEKALLLTMRDVVRPTIVCLCGSTRFCAPEYQDASGLTPWQRANLEETLAGNIVLTIGVDTKSDAGLHLTAEDKLQLDALHLAKIDLADEVLVLNVGKYIGESTRREVKYAQDHGKIIRWLEPEHAIGA